MQGIDIEIRGAEGKQGSIKIQTWNFLFICILSLDNARNVFQHYPWCILITGNGNLMPGGMDNCASVFLFHLILI